MTLGIKYSPQTGIMYRSAGRKPGPVLSKSLEGYKTIKVRKEFWFQHRLAFSLMNSKIPTGYVVDHINGVRDDNRWKNLRSITRQQNTSAVSSHQKLRTDNSSGHFGVYWHKNRRMWEAKITYKGKCYFLGNYKEKEIAAAKVQEFINN